MLPLTVAPSTGFSSYVENIGKLRNTGIEGRLRLNLIRDTQRDLRWNVTLSAFHNKSKITKLSNQWKRSINMLIVIGIIKELSCTGNMRPGVRKQP